MRKRETECSGSYGANLHFQPLCIILSARVLDTGSPTPVRAGAALNWQHEKIKKNNGHRIYYYYKHLFSLTFESLLHCSFKTEIQIIFI